LLLYGFIIVTWGCFSCVGSREGLRLRRGSAFLLFVIPNLVYEATLSSVAEPGSPAHASCVGVEIEVRDLVFRRREQSARSLTPAHALVTARVR